jgi:Sugar-transfer associated ATP-grasp
LPLASRTNAKLAGTMLPNWIELRNLVTKAAHIFPGIRTQSWDIALTEKGPVCLEVNYGGDLSLAQLAEGRGLLDEVYRDHLSTCRYRFRRPHSAARKGAPFAESASKVLG